MAWPLLYLDVDGVLNPDPISWSKPRRPEGFVTHRMRPKGFERRIGIPPLRVWLNPDHGPMLLSLHAELVWGTTWEHDANVWIAPHIGLPRLDVVEFGTGPHPVKKGQPHWKVEHLVKHACGRPFIWLDDEISQTDVETIDYNHQAPHLLLRPNPTVGLSQNHIERMRAWITALEQEGGQ